MNTNTPPDLLRRVSTRVDEVYMEIGCLERRRKEQAENMHRQDKGLAEIKDLLLGVAAQLRAAERLQKQALHKQSA